MAREKPKTEEMVRLLSNYICIHLAERTVQCNRCWLCCLVDLDSFLAHLSDDSDSQVNGQREYIMYTVFYEQNQYAAYLR